MAKKVIPADHPIVSGKNIKTINGESIVGSGDIQISGGGGGGGGGDSTWYRHHLYAYYYPTPSDTTTYYTIYVDLYNHDSTNYSALEGYTASGKIYNSIINFCYCTRITNSSGATTVKMIPLSSGTYANYTSYYLTLTNIDTASSSTYDSIRLHFDPVEEGSSIMKHGMTILDDIVKEIAV